MELRAKRFFIAILVSVTFVSLPPGHHFVTVQIRGIGVDFTYYDYEYMAARLFVQAW
jgi:hypothetical protein